MTTKTQNKLKHLALRTLRGLALVAGLAALGWWILDIVFSDMARYMVGPT